MNLNSREFRRLKVKSSFNRRCCRCCLNCFLEIGQQASACTFDQLFVRFPSLCFVGLFVVCRLSKHFSAVHSVVIVCAGDICLLCKLLLEFRIYELFHIYFTSVSKCIKTYREPRLPNLSSKSQRKHPNSVGGFPLL